MSGKLIENCELDVPKIFTKIKYMNFIYYKRNLYKNYIYSNSPNIEHKPKARQCVLYCHRPPPHRVVMFWSEATKHSTRLRVVKPQSEAIGFSTRILYCIICNISVFKINTPYIQNEYTLYSKLIHPIFILNIPQQNQLIAI